ncbi:hypothetical protein Tco_0891173 [Tanacetum coccineum]|uniref:Uncharacterized protein n=1 Tax=Tanacetum coccineum TaxID=301880 RepID=A0ABQ5C2I1_9ASTR
MQERPNLSKTQGASTPEEVKSMECHWTFVKTILMYLRNTDMVPVYRGNLENELRVTCYTDGLFETDKDDRKSQLGYVFILNEGAID